METERLRTHVEDVPEVGSSFWLGCVVQCLLYLLFFDVMFPNKGLIPDIGYRTGCHGEFGGPASIISRACKVEA